MSPSEIWIIAIVVALFAGVIGFVIGRKKAPGSPEQVEQLAQAHEAQLAKKQAEFDAYREEVHLYHEKTANLLVSMAAPYKGMFDHLTEGYDKLGNLSERKVLPDRAGALLDGPDANKTVVPELTEDLKLHEEKLKAKAALKDY